MNSRVSPRSSPARIRSMWLNRFHSPTQLGMCRAGGGRAPSDEVGGTRARRVGYVAVRTRSTWAYEVW